MLILAIALVIRIGLAREVQARVDVARHLCLIPGDAEGYWELAQRIVAGQDYSLYNARFAMRMPGFPLILALSHAVFGPNPLAARYVLACVGTIACGLTYWLGRELVDSGTGLLAAAYIALSPTQALFSVLFLSESAFAVALLVSLIVITRYVLHAPGNPGLSESVLRSTLAGVAIGISTLVRPTWLYVGLAISLAIVVFKMRTATKPVLFAGQFTFGLLLGVGLSLAPWTIRNYDVTGHVVPTVLWVGPSLYDGLNPNATGDSNMQFFEDDNLLSHMSEFEMDREYRRRAWRFVFSHPLRTAWLAVIKQTRYWSLVPNAEQFQNPLLSAIVLAAVLPLFLFSALGFWKIRKDPGCILIAFGPVLLFAAIHLLFVGSLRYRLPAECPMAIAAAIGLRSSITSLNPHFCRPQLD